MPTPVVAAFAESLTVALLGLFGVLVTAGLAAWTQVFLRRNVGTKNGQGNVTEMLERALENQGVVRAVVETLGERLSGVEETLIAHDTDDRERFERIEKWIGGPSE